MNGAVWGVTSYLFARGGRLSAKLIRLSLRGLELGAPGIKLALHGEARLKRCLAALWSLVQGACGYETVF